jgi:hypothetical protein
MIPGRSANYWFTSSIIRYAATPTALIAQAENRYTIIPPINPPQNTSAVPRSTTISVSYVPTRSLTVSRNAENSRNVANAADPTAYPFVNAFVVFPTASRRSVLALICSGY